MCEAKIPANGEQPASHHLIYLCISHNVRLDALKVRREEQSCFVVEATRLDLVSCSRREKNELLLLTSAGLSRKLCFPHLLDAITGWLFKLNNSFYPFMFIKAHCETFAANEIPQRQFEAGESEAAKPTTPNLREIYVDFHTDRINT